MIQTREDIAAAVRQLIVDKQKTCARKPTSHVFTEASDFSGELGFDSLDHIEMIFAVEAKFDLEVPDADAENLKTIGQAIDYLVKRLGVAVAA